MTSAHLPRSARLPGAAVAFAALALGALGPSAPARALVPAAAGCAAPRLDVDANSGWAQVVAAAPVVRQDPTADSESLGALRRCAVVPLRYRTEGGGGRQWYRLDDRAGWVSDQAVHVLRPAPHI
ncbi:hypothetical protein ABZ832_19795 [Streptantibioticus parmotrematis]|uniref:hypothetical protein n=1 Tax=Streptantibioticus parmotrematis TaxID=2873249 RepID=UPI0033EF140F